MSAEGGVIGGVYQVSNSPGNRCPAELSLLQGERYGSHTQARHCGSCLSTACGLRACSTWGVAISRAVVVVIANPTDEYKCFNAHTIVDANHNNPGFLQHDCLSSASIDEPFYHNVHVLRHKCTTIFAIVDQHYDNPYLFPQHKCSSFVTDDSYYNDTQPVF
ncbi:hypothetical protein EV356DRAFT_502656 [Viridothelium virens]|uniref:Uncharacterized protein n=1 Tax=Viridothelium virens TaxID=1048519 RepID=A0A6A6H8B0_VIRVR|nr:hypothetical protein EV356DRAFT_502656 [Viridothelium virens]